MKKFMSLLLLLAASLVFVSCPGPESPVSPVPEPEDTFTPPVDIRTFDQFVSFTQGFWKSTENDTYWFRVTPEKVVYSDALVSHTRSNFNIAANEITYYDAYIKESSSAFEIDSSVQFDYETLFSDGNRISLFNMVGGTYFLASFFKTTETGYPFKPYNGGYCYYIGLEGTGNSGWYYKVSSDWNYDPSSGSGSGSGGGSGSLDAYIGEYSYSGTYNGSITVSDGSWSYNTSKAGAENAVVAGSAEMSGSNVKLYYTMPGVQGTLSEVFTVTINGSSATWRCIESNGYTAATSIIFSGLFGVTDTQISFSYEE